MLSYDYPLLGLFWTMMWWFLWIAWIVVLFRVIVDIFRSRDLGGWAKGAVDDLRDRGALARRARLPDRAGSLDERPGPRGGPSPDAALRSYVQETAGSGGGAADELSKLAQLRDRGVITEAEFTQQKARLLA